MKRNLREKVKIINFDCCPHSNPFGLPENKKGNK